MFPAVQHRFAGRRQAIAAGAFLALFTTTLGAGASSAGAAETGASDDTAITGSGVPVTVDVLANDTIAGVVSSVQPGAVVGGDAATVSVGEDMRITFANANPDFPNSSAARVFKTADFTVPYTVTTTDGATVSATLTVTVAGKPVSPTVSSWILNDPAAGGVKTLKALTQLDLRPYPQTVASFKSVVPGHGVSVTGLVAGEHASAVPVAGGIELRAEPREYIGNDILTLELTDTWGRTVEHTAGVSWVERAAVAKHHVKVGVGHSAHVDLQQLVAGTSLANFPGGTFTSTRDVWNATLTTGTHAQDLIITPKAGFTGTSTDSVGTRVTWAYRLTNPWQRAGYTGPATDAKTNTLYVDVQAPPQAAGIDASTTADQPVDLDLRAPATLPWTASTLELREQPQHGTATIVGDGTVRYTPDAAFPHAEMLSDTDSFTFAWIDDLGQESQARATVTVRNGPTLADHTLTTEAGVAVTVELLTDASGDSVTISSTGPALTGSVDLTGTTATYLPQPGFVGDDSFTYQGVDAYGQQAEGTVRIQVLGAQVVADEHHGLPRDITVEDGPETQALALSGPEQVHSEVQRGAGDGRPGSEGVLPAQALPASADAPASRSVLATTGFAAGSLVGAALLCIALGMAGVVRGRRGASRV